ncbi:hypothetical protein [Burkholderia multivorans]|uniref:hypothetical protein n=1 Tax=Burkholderia multivorans TaxID=87883 RepID=UPI0012DAA637|nr:hypothetical protein [Burkholderia multivorans]MBU9560571.1 hypothetical protein [Burkholderia multivorans]
MQQKIMRRHVLSRSKVALEAGKELGSGQIALANVAYSAKVSDVAGLIRLRSIKAI